MKMKNSIFPPKYTRHAKTVRKQKYLFQKGLQVGFWTFLHTSYIFCLLMKDIIKN